MARGPWPAGERLSAPTLRARHLYGALTRLDTQVLLFEVAPELSPSRRAEIVELAAYDLDLAAELALAELPGHARYVELCRARALALGLDDAHAPPLNLQASTREPRALEPLWQSGALDVFDGWPTAHPGLVSDQDIERCLWRGQIKALLPFLDQMRLTLIEVTQRRGLYPQPSRGDTAELIDLLRALDRARPGHELTRAAREHTHARNKLAHLQFVDEARRQRLREAIRRARLADVRAL